MSVEKCLIDVSRKYKLNKNEVKRTLKELDDYATRAEERAQRSGNVDDISYAAALDKKRAEIEAYLDDLTEHKKFQEMVSIKRRMEMWGQIQRLRQKGLSPKDSMIAVLDGSLSSVEGAGNSIGNLQRTLQTKYIGNFIRDLEENGVDRVFSTADDQFELLLAKEIQALNTDGASPNPTGNKNAYKVAEIYVKHRKAQIGKLRENGAFIRDLQGYITKQSHNREKIVLAGKDQWKADVLSRIDTRRTFGDNFDPEEFDAWANSRFKEIEKGVRANEVILNDPSADDFMKGGNVANSLARSRELHFKSAEDFVAYNSKYGHGSIRESMLHSMQHAGFYDGLLRRMGPRPRQNYEWLKQKLIDLDDAGKDSFAPRISDKLIGRDTDALFNNLDGSAFVAASPRAARIGQNIRGMQAMTKLGGALISQLGDVPIKAQVLQDNGIKFADSYVQPFNDAIQRLPRSQRRYFASMVDTYSDVTVGALSSRLGVFDSQPGKMNRALRVFFKANGMEWWTTAQKEGMAAALSHNLYNYSKFSWEKIDDGLRRQLQMYDINAKDWDTIRKGIVKLEDGRSYVLAEALDDVPIRDKLETYFMGEVNDGVITPNARARAIQNGGMPPGTLGGEFMRHIMLFRTFPVTFTQRVLGKRYLRDGIMGLTQPFIMGTAFGAVSMTAKDYLKGRRRDVDQKFVAAAALQGGGLGIFGDFLFGEIDRYGNSLQATALGPSFGALNQAVRTALTVIKAPFSDEKDANDAMKEVFKLVNRELLPGNNLFYVAPIYNYAVAYQIQEALNPGYLQRMEQRMESQSGISFIREPVDLRPSQNVLFD